MSNGISIVTEGFGVIKLIDLEFHRKFAGGSAKPASKLTGS